MYAAARCMCLPGLGLSRWPGPSSTAVARVAPPTPPPSPFAHHSLDHWTGPPLPPSHFLSPQVTAPPLHHFPRPPLRRAAPSSPPSASARHQPISPSRDLHLSEAQLREMRPSCLARWRGPTPPSPRPQGCSPSLASLRGRQESRDPKPAWLLIAGNPPLAGPSPPRSVRPPWPWPRSRAGSGNRKKAQPKRPRPSHDRGRSPQPHPASPGRGPSRPLNPVHQPARGHFRPGNF
jgi:hypothetical protein